MILKEKCPPRKFRPDIQGLRAIAVIAVIISHFGLGLSGGFVGVDIFFVISGYLITLHLFSEALRTKKISLSKFYAKRILRILPASIFILLLTFTASIIWLSPVRTLEYTKDAFFSAISFVNYHFARVETDYFNSATTPSPFQHYWSLAVEEQFYLIWPLIVLILTKLFGKIKRNFQLIISIVLLSIIGFSLYQSYIVTEQSQPWAYFGLHTRAWQLAVGALAAVNINTLSKIPSFIASPISWLGLGGIIGSFFIIDKTTLYPGLWSLIPTIFSFLAIIGGINLNKKSAETILKTLPFQWIGKISYSLYLVHWPLYVIPLYLLEDNFRIRYKIGLIILSIIIAHLSFIFVENKARLSKNIKNSLIKTYLIGLILVTVSAGITGGFFWYKTIESEERKDNIDVKEFSGNRSELTKKIEKGIEMQKVPEKIYKSLDIATKDRYPNCITPVESSSELEKKNICQLGDTKSKKVIVLIGDSHAHQWTQTIDNIAKNNKYKLITYTRSACPLDNVFVYNTILEREYTECYQWKKQALEEIEKLNPDIIIYSRYSKYEELNPKAFEETIVELKSISKNKVIYILDTPIPKQNIPECLGKNKKNIEKCEFTEEEAIYSKPLRKSEIEIGQRLNAQIIDTTNLFCHNNICPPIIDNIVVYRDDSHISKTYSNFLTNVLEEKININ